MVRNMVTTLGGHQEPPLMKWCKLIWFDHMTRHRILMKTFLKRTLRGCTTRRGTEGRTGWQKQSSMQDLLTTIKTGLSGESLQPLRLSTCCPWQPALRDHHSLSSHGNGQGMCVLTSLMGRPVGFNYWPLMETSREQPLKLCEQFQLDAGH